MSEREEVSIKCPVAQSKFHAEVRYSDGTLLATYDEYKCPYGEGECIYLDNIDIVCPVVG